MGVIEAARPSVPLVETMPCFTMVVKPLWPTAASLRPVAAATPTRAAMTVTITWERILADQSYGFLL